MNIGFDLDKIFIDYPPLIPNTVIDHLYRQKTNGALLYRIPSKPEQFLRLLTHYSFFRPPIIKNIEFAKKICRKNRNRHYLISSRFGFLKKRTRVLIQKYRLNKIFDEMYFNFENKQPHIFKNEVIKKLKIDRYVDDDLLLLQFLARKNQKTKFFWLNNKCTKPLRKNLFAITKLSEILQ